VVGKVGINLGVKVTGASVQNGRVQLQLTDDAGTKKTLSADHVIAATGYKYELPRVTFLGDVLSGIQCVQKTPVLSSNFESTVKNLYFVGVTSANTFGPLLRFAFGAGFAAPRISRHLARTASSDSVKQGPRSKTHSTEEVESSEPVAR
jgi:hypothetical protein